MDYGEPIRILHVIGIMDRGGAETMIMNLYRNIDRTRIQFDFVVHNQNSGIYASEVEALGGRFYHCPQFRIKNMPAYIKWWKQFFKREGQGYHIVHGHIGSSAAVYLYIAKKNGKFTIAHSHSSGKPRTMSQIVYCLAAYPTRYIADYFFACSQAACVDRYGSRMIMDKSRYTILKNAIETSQFVFDKGIRSNIRTQLEYKDKHRVIGHVGRFVEPKNHDFLLDVFVAAVKADPDLRLLLVGDGPLRLQIENKSKRMGIYDKVTFLGVCSNVNELLMAMDVFLFPSLYEGLGIVLIEAQTTGLPCVISQTIPNEAIINSDLVYIENLNNSVNNWADVLSSINVETDIRNTCATNVINSGYDVKYTAKWLEDFYYEHM